jgi:Putative peptidoglycan binding domain
MNISESDLSAEYQRAKSKWPFIHETELAHGLPRMLLFAVGSRETSLTNEVGDFGHGHGVWQLDDRSHTPPGGKWEQLDANVALQCAIVAATLRGMLITRGSVEDAAAIFNSGQPGEFGTVYHDYGIDVLQRMQFLQRKFRGDSSVQQNFPTWFHRDLGLVTPFTIGDDVTVVQEKTSTYPDGVFGPVTQMHVVNFQAHYGLFADGIVGSITARVLGS